MEKNNEMNELNRVAWDSYQEEYMKFELLDNPNTTAPHKIRYGH